MDRGQKLILDRPRWRQMAPDKQLLEAWESGVALGDAWLAFADPENRKRYFKARREGSPSSVRISLEIDLVARLSDGELQAIGIEDGSDPTPVFIPRYFFSRSAEVSVDGDTVAAFGKKFHEVRVQGERAREPADQARLSEPPPIIDPREITAQWARERLSPPSVPKTSDEQDEITGQWKRELLQETPPSEQAPSIKPRMGRKPLVPILSKIVRELIDERKLAGKSKKEITELVRERAHERLKNDFYGANSPSKPTIYAALLKAGWPPADEK
jgi:hypothetical protein